MQRPTLANQFSAVCTTVKTQKAIRGFIYCADIDTHGILLRFVYGIIELGNNARGTEHQHGNKNGRRNICNENNGVQR